jgi:hypothetical protein
MQNMIEVSNKLVKSYVINCLRSLVRSRIARLARTATACTLLLSGAALGAPFTIVPTFTNNFVTNFGANAVAAENAWIAAANVFTSNFTDPITVNITVDAVTGASTFGASNTFLVQDTYADLRNRLIADAKSADDFTATGPGGSITAADPTGGAGNFWTTRAEAKAIGLIASDALNDGTTTFGAGNPFTFSGPVAPGTYDFQGIAAHEISEVLGRLGLGGGTVNTSGGAVLNSYSVVDLFSYSGAGTPVLGNGGAAGAQGSFSIDNGTTLLKQFNDQFSNGLDYRDWAAGTNDAFNQFSFSGVTNAVSNVDLQLMDVIGYDRVVPAPEPATGILLISGLLVGYLRRRR